MLMQHNEIKMSNHMIAVIAFSHFGCVLLGGASALLFKELIVEKEESEMSREISKLKRENRELVARIKWQYEVQDKKGGGEGEGEGEGEESQDQAGGEVEGQGEKVQVIDPNYINAIEERNKYLIDRNDLLAEQVAYLKRNGESAHQNMFRAYIVTVIVGLMALITTTAMYNYTTFAIKKCF